MALDPLRPLDHSGVGTRLFVFLFLLSLRGGVFAKLRTLLKLVQYICVFFLSKIVFSTTVVVILSGGYWRSHF